MDYAYRMFAFLSSTHYICIHSGFRVVSFDPSADRDTKFFTTSHKIIATLCGRLRSLPLAPNHVVAFQFAQALKLPRPSLNAFKFDIMHGKSVSRLQPPSASKSKSLTARVRGRECLIKAASSEIHRGNLDPDQDKDNYIQLQWQRDAPKFSGDLDIYVWERHKAHPVSPCAEVQYFPRSDGDETNLVITFRHETSLLSFCDFCERYSSGQQSVIATDQVWSCSSEIFISICALFQVIVLEMTNFLQGAYFELERMVS